MMTIVTYNAKTNRNGNRLNLVVNHSTKELYFYGCNAFNLGNVYDDLPIRFVSNMHKDLLAEGWTTVSHSHVRDNWMRHDWGEAQFGLI